MIYQLSTCCYEITRRQWIRAWVEKYILRLHSPSAHANGYAFMWDMYSSIKRNTTTMSMQENLEAWERRYEQLEEFAKYVANAVMRDDFMDETSAELFCRRLYKLGYICKIDGEWALMEDEK